MFASNCTLMLLTVVFAVEGEAARQADRPPMHIDEVELAVAVWERAPGVLEARRQLVGTESVADQARLLPNPELAATWATIPVGSRNPPGQPFSQVPSYGIGVSQLLELGKRGPRRRAAEATATAGRLRLEDAYRQSFFSVMETLADQAAATARAAALARLAEGSTQNLALQRVRAEKGDAAGLDVDRIEVDHLRLLSRITQMEVEREAASRACALALGGACPRIDDPATAHGLLERGLSEPLIPLDQDVIDERPDVRALLADKAAATEEERLASRLRIPDPTVAIGFTHDQFTVAGNQANSLTLSVGLPLPVFDWGQVARRRAERQADVLEVAAAARRGAARAAARTEMRQLELVRDRARQLDDQALPRARSVVTRMETAARRGGVAWPEVLLARRTWEELQLERVDLAVDGYRLLLTLREASGSLPDPRAAPHRGKR